MLSTSPETSSPVLRAVRSVHLGHRLRQARERAGLTQEDIAQRLGIDESVPSRWECERATRYRPVPANRLDPLAHILGTTLSELAPEALEPERGPGTDPDDEEAGFAIGMLTATDLYDGDGEAAALSQTAGAVPRNQPPEYSTTAYPLGPSPAPGRPQEGVVTLRCPWCGFKHRQAAPEAPTYTRDPLPNDNCGCCGRQMRARVSISRIR